MRVLVTGGTGFIGRHAVTALDHRGHDVVIAARRRLDRSHIEIDLMRPTAAQLSAVKGGGFDTLLMLAWETTHGQFWGAPSNSAWTAASLQLVDAFFDAGGKRVVAAGTCVEYDAPPEGPCIANETNLAPVHPYSISKDATRRVIEWRARQVGASFSWGRIFLAYGPHEDHRRLVPSVINNLLAGRPARCSSGKQIRDFLHAQDYGRAFAALTEVEHDGALNVCSGIPVTIGDVARQIGDRLGRPDLIELGALQDRPDEPANLWGLGATLRDVFDFKPTFSLGEGLDQTITWWKKHGEPAQALTNGIGP